MGSVLFAFGELTTNEEVRALTPSLPEDVSPMSGTAPRWLVVTLTSSWLPVATTLLL